MSKKLLLAASATDANPTSEAAGQELRAALLQPGLALLPASFDDLIFLPPLVGPGGRLVAPVADWETKRHWVQYAFGELEKAGYTVASGYTAVKNPDLRSFTTL